MLQTEVLCCYENLYLISTNPACAGSLNPTIKDRFINQSKFIFCVSHSHKVLALSYGARQSSLRETAARLVQNDGTAVNNALPSL